MKLTPEGWTQAYDAGRRLRSLLKEDDTLHFFTSPYRRTRETTQGILQTLTSDDPSPSPFPRHKIKVYEEPRLREQDFGNFQPCSAEMERMWQERADYGHFFYRIPNGESAADAYDRISGFNESLWRQFGDDDCASVCILGRLYCSLCLHIVTDRWPVTHGLMSRVFLMKWYHFSVEYFEDLRNVNHCEFLIMRKQDETGKYLLENELRTWSELKREREAERNEKDKSMPAEKVTKNAQSPILRRKQWGGCPNGCNHGINYTKRDKTANGAQPNSTQLNGKETGPAPRRLQSYRLHSFSEDEDDPRGRAGPLSADVQKSMDEVVSSLDEAPSITSAEIHLNGRLKSPNRILLLQAGRDFGGSASGDTSRAGSDNEASMDEVAFKPNRKVPSLRKAVESFHESGMRRGAKADALGDQSDVGSDEEGDDDGDDELKKQEAEDKSIIGSVY